MHSCCACFSPLAGVHDLFQYCFVVCLILLCLIKIELWFPHGVMLFVLFDIICFCQSFHVDFIICYYFLKLIGFTKGYDALCCC